MPQIIAAELVFLFLFSMLWKIMPFCLFLDSLMSFMLLSEGNSVQINRYLLMPN